MNHRGLPQRRGSNVYSPPRGGTNRWLTSSAVKQQAGASPTYEIPVGESALEVTDAGDVFIGPNELISRASSGTQGLHQVLADSYYNASTRRVYHRHERLTEISNPANLALGRWGPDNEYPFPLAGPDKKNLRGIKAGQTIGLIRWDPAVAGLNGRATVGNAHAAVIFAQGQEDPVEVTPNHYATGARLHFSTTPVGSGSSTERVIITAVGAVGVLGSQLSGSSLYGNSAAWGTGDLIIGGHLYPKGELRHQGSKVGLNGVTPVVKAGAITSPTGGGVIDSEARTAIDSLRLAVKNIGITA